MLMKQTVAISGITSGIDKGLTRNLSSRHFEFHVVQSVLLLNFANTKCHVSQFPSGKIARNYFLSPSLEP